eukprot:1141216-Pelagomonas_calceolata.AAC.1
MTDLGQPMSEGHAHDLHVQAQAEGSRAEAGNGRKVELRLCVEDSEPIVTHLSFAPCKLVAALVDMSMQGLSPQVLLGGGGSSSITS